MHGWSNLQPLPLPPPPLTMARQTVNHAANDTGAGISTGGLLVHHYGLGPYECLKKRHLTNQRGYRHSTIGFIIFKNRLLWRVMKRFIKKSGRLDCAYFLSLESFLLIKASGIACLRANQSVAIPKALIRGSGISNQVR